MTPEETSWLLISRAISGDITAGEREDLEHLLLLNPDLRADYENLKNLRLRRSGPASGEERRALEKGLDKFDQLLNNYNAPAALPVDAETAPLKRPAYFKWAVAAAVISMIIGLSVLFKLKPSNQALQQRELVTQFGKRIHKTLPDGSVIWLNSGSSVKYTDGLVHNGKREVTLNGEAFFDVRHDSKHPFIVNAGNLRIVVLGTAFNVKAYAADKFTETTLLRGKVEILMSSRPGMNITLLPNQKVRVVTGKNEVKKTLLVPVRQPSKDSVRSVAERQQASPGLTDQQFDETAWIADRLIFKRETFAELARRLERWYDVKIIFDDDKYQQRQFTGKFKDQDIREVMRALQFTQPFNYTITDNRVHIW